jgi:hypothetical protein
MLETQPKTAIPATFQHPQRRRLTAGSLGKLSRHHEIGQEMYAAGPPQNRVGMGAPKVPHQRPLIVHYLSVVTAP